MKEVVTNKIRLLKHIKPNPDWLKSQRSNLLLEISQSGKKTQRVWSLPGFLVTQTAFKPVAAFCLLLLIVFGGGFFVVQAAKGSLPGDLLYPVKITLESAQMKVSSEVTKPKLQAEFVGHRVEELSQIIEKTEDPIKKKEKVVRAVDKLQAQVVSAKTELDKVREAQPEKVVEVTDAVNEKLAEAKKVVEELSEDLAIILDDKEKAQEITGQMEVVKIEEPSEVDEPIITSPVIPIPINEASASFEDTLK